VLVGESCIAKVDAAYTLRQRSATYTDNFAGENNALMLDNAIPWTKNAKNAET